MNPCDKNPTPGERTLIFPLLISLYSFPLTRRQQFQPPDNTISSLVVQFHIVSATLFHPRAVSDCKPHTGIHTATHTHSLVSPSCLPAFPPSTTAIQGLILATGRSLCHPVAALTAASIHSVLSDGCSLSSDSHRS